MANAQPYEETVYDFFSEGKLIFLFAGYSWLRRTDPGFVPYSIYKGLLLPFLGFFILMSYLAAFLSVGKTADTIQAIHVSLMLEVAFFGLLIRLVEDRALLKTIRIIRLGVYHYEDWETDEQHEKIKKYYVDQIRRMNDTFKKLCGFGVLTNALLVPIIQLMMVEEGSDEGVLNPYLPQPVYMPFNTRTFFGYSAAFIIHTIFIGMTMAIGTCMNAIFLGSTLQMKAQFQILNHSLKNLEKRAYAYTRSHSNYSTSEDFQDGLYTCFRANILHYQALLRLKVTFQHCMGCMFLIVVACASLVLAAHVLLILEKPEIHKMVNFVITLTCEMLYTLHYCWCGEELIAESSEVYYSFYYTPWYRCDKRFRKLLSIMLSYTRSPVYIKTPGLDITASLDTFGSIISTMYRLMSLVRNA